MLKASEARDIATEYSNKMEREYETKRKVREKKEREYSEAMWKERGPALVHQIEGYIRKAAAEGSHGTWEPSSINRKGDSILYLSLDDVPVKELLMTYFRLQGFMVEDYAYGGLKITW